MTTTDSFSFMRFSALMRKYILENWKKLLMYVTIIAGTLIIMSIIIAGNHFSYYGLCLQNPSYEFPLADTTTNSMISSFVFWFFIFGFISASMTMTSMKNKTGRISTLMTPATQLEKYIVRVTIYIIGFTVIYILCCVLADLARYAFTVLLHPEYSGLIRLFCLSDISSCNDDSSITVMAYIFVITQSFYVLGSSIWAKNSFIKTFIALVILNLIFTTVGAISFKLLLESIGKVDFDPESKYEQYEYVIKYVIPAIILVINYTLAYYRFKEAEIINRI